MPEILGNIPNYDFPVDAYVRRFVHELGSRKVSFYKEAFKRRRFNTDDIVLDIGAGIGLDGLEIARQYRPRWIYLLEPGQTADDGLTDKFNFLDEYIAREAPPGVKIVDSENLERAHPAFTYLQPIQAKAEAIPLPDAAVTKVIMVHSAQEFDDLNKGLSEAQRVLAEGGEGLLITNGRGDKLKFRELLKSLGEALNLVSLNTVSSRLDYGRAIIELNRLFEVEDVFIYKDIMQIDRETLPIYLWQFDSYRSAYGASVERWSEVKSEVVTEPIKREMAKNGGIFTDTIDICAVYFKKNDQL